MRISETKWNNLPNQSFANSEADPELRQVSAEDVSEASKAAGNMQFCLKLLCQHFFVTSKHFENTFAAHLWSMW